MHGLPLQFTPGVISFSHSVGKACLAQCWPYSTHALEIEKKKQNPWILAAWQLKWPLTRQPMVIFFTNNMSDFLQTDVRK